MTQGIAAEDFVNLSTSIVIIPRIHDAMRELWVQLTGPITQQEPALSVQKSSFSEQFNEHLGTPLVKPTKICVTLLFPDFRYKRLT